MNQRLSLALLGLGVSSLAILQACGGGASGGSSSQMVIEDASNGFGRMLPHRIAVPDANGDPTSDIIEIRKLDDLLENVTLSNQILPATEWPTTSVLPNGESGNHFIYVRFRQPIDVTSVLDAAASANVNNHLKGPITVLGVDPITGASVPIGGRAFVGGQTYGTPDPLNPSVLLLERWVGLDGNNKPIALAVNGAFPGLGFPGTQSTLGFAGQAELVDLRTLVFVVDEDEDLTTHETFPAGLQIRMSVTQGVLSQTGRNLLEEGLASATVGPDTICPEVSVSGQSQSPVIVPGNGDVDVDPRTTIAISFTEPIQLRTVGDLNDGTSPAISASILLQFGQAAAKVTVPFWVEPASVYDLSRLELTPVYNFPGSGVTDDDISCGNFSVIDVIVSPEQFRDLSNNLNTLSPSTNFTTREGPGLVNAPIAPDAIYVVRGGASPGISVIDLNGYGAGPGDPTFDIADRIEPGHTNFPNDPNVALQGALLIPPLAPGTCTIDGGSPGVFTLARDSSLNDMVAAAPLLDSVGDMALGHALDNAFNNSLPFGCQAGGGNICAATGLKIVSIAAGGANTLAPSTVSTFPIKTVFGAENLVSWAPHPNPPPLQFPPLCLSPLIGAREPTSINTIQPPPVGPGLTNLLTPGPFPLGIPDANIPPQGLLTLEQNIFFIGPTPPQAQISLCLPYMYRQQIGQFLYVIDRAASEVVVFNSNRFTIIDRIVVPDPTSFAMSPNLDYLAVTNQTADIVSFIDTDPTSSSFHKIVKTTTVGRAPNGIAWEPGNEDILVCNQGDNTVSILSAQTLNVRKIIRNQLNGPFEVAITPRQLGFGFFRGVYFAYILNRDGTLAIFESGPDGINGWGYDDVIGIAPFTFTNPKTIQPDVRNLNSAVWVIHENQLGADGLPTGTLGGAASNMALTSGVTGIIPLDQGFFGNPSFRDLEFSIVASIGSNTLTGVPTDIAFDNQRNMTALTNYATQFSAGFPLSINGKSLVKPSGGAIVPVAAPQFLFFAVPNSNEGPGVIDVIELASGFPRFDTNAFEPGVQSIPATNAAGLMDFMRQ